MEKLIVIDCEGCGCSAGGAGAAILGSDLAGILVISEELVDMLHHSKLGF